MGSSSRAASGPGVIRIQALRYRSLRYVSQELGPFQVLVGPNASGKSNFLDVVAFLGDLVDTDLVTAIGGDWRLGIPLRATDGRHLTWMRRPCPPLRRREYLPDGSNLPHVVHALETDHPGSHERWVKHVSEALPDVAGITTREREEDRHRYLVLRYSSGLEAPSWLVSDGTLRLLALTLLAYLPDLTGLFLIEEPENGIHPRALETVLQSLSSVYGAQILLATHSPLVVRLADRHQLVCLARSAEGATDVVSGTEHPVLRDWQGTADLGTLLASGILG